MYVNNDIPHIAVIKGDISLAETLMKLGPVTNALNLDELVRYTSEHEMHELTVMLLKYIDDITYGESPQRRFRL